jgi:hypothetical protein
MIGSAEMKTLAAAAHANIITISFWISALLLAGLMNRSLSLSFRPNWAAILCSSGTWRTRWR